MQSDLSSLESILFEYLKLSVAEFRSAFEASSLEAFLVSHVKPQIQRAPLFHDSLLLRKYVFLIVHRILTENKDIPASLLDCSFLGDFSRVYFETQALQSLLRHTWDTRSATIKMSLEKTKTELGQRLLRKQWTEIDDQFCAQQLLPLIYSLPEIGTYFALGSDFIDSVGIGYNSIEAASHSNVLLLAYLCLIAPLQQTKPVISLCFDHLYGLRSNAEQDSTNPDAAKLLSDLISETPLLARVKNVTSGTDKTRATDLAYSLEKFRRSSSEHRKSKTRKSKETVTNKASIPSSASHLNVHRMSLVTQVQDLFPELGSAYILKLLEEYNDNVETVISHLLDGSLPLRIQELDQTENLPGDDPGHQELAPRPTPRPSPIPARRNVFDDDDFDRLAVDASRIRLGKGRNDDTADRILSDRTQAPNKAAILSALAAFDSDDDERDDTYDLEDVGGSVDAARPGVDDTATDKDETGDTVDQALFEEYRANPGLFQRDPTIRRSQARQKLKDSTGMTDEAIEGWAIMIGRDPKRLRVLEGKFSSFSGHQRELQRTAWRMPADSATDDSENSGPDRSRLGGLPGRGRGSRGGGRGRGGNVGGPASEGTQVARNRKEVNKGSRANHNRRDQRARKMARGGMSG